MPPQPARLGANDGVLAVGKAGNEIGLHPVGAVVSAAGRPKMQAPLAAKSFSRAAPVGANVIALNNPAVQAFFKAGVAEAIVSADLGHKQVIHQAFAATQQKDLQLVIGAAPVVQSPAILQSCPFCLPCLVTVRPVGGKPVVASRILQLQTASAAVGPTSPPASVVIYHLVHRDPDGVLYCLSSFGQHFNQVRSLKCHSPPIIGQRTAEIAQRVGFIEIGIMLRQIGRVLGHRQITARGDATAFEEAILHFVRKAPSAQIDRTGGWIVQLDILAVFLIGKGVIHKFVNHDFGHRRRRIGLAGGEGRQGTPLPGAVGKASGGNAVGLTEKTKRIHYSTAFRGPQRNPLAFGAKRKPKRVLIQSQESASRNHRPLRKNIALLFRIVGQSASRQIHTLIRVVVQLHKIQNRIIRMRQKLVDHDAPIRSFFVWFFFSRRTARQKTRLPSLGISFAKRRFCQRQRMAETIGRHRPFSSVLILHFQQERARSMPEANSSRSIG